MSHSAGVAQLVEHLICNQRVRGSNPFASSRSVPESRACCAARRSFFPTALHKEAFPNGVSVRRSFRVLPFFYCVGRSSVVLALTLVKGDRK